MSHVRRRLWLFVALVTAGVTASGLLVGALAHAADEPPAPRITFTPVGTPPTACGSRPDVSSLSVPVGTAIVIANRTEVSADVVVGGETVLTVAHGEGASLALAPGQYDIRVIPECASLAVTLPVAVMVTASSPPVESTGPAPPPPTTAAPVSPAGSTTTASPRRPAGQAPGQAPAASPTGEPVLAPAATSAGPAGRPSRTSAAGPTAGILSVSPVALDAQDPPKGLRLLAAIATICVLGVTAAIIRAIVRLSP